MDISIIILIFGLQLTLAPRFKEHESRPYRPLFVKVKKDPAYETPPKMDNLVRKLSYDYMYLVEDFSITYKDEENSPLVVFPDIRLCPRDPFPAEEKKSAMIRENIISEGDTHYCLHIDAKTSDHEYQINKYGCDEEVLPLIMPSKDEKSCGPNGSGELYEFLYLWCQFRAKRVQRIVVYRFCYEPNKATVIYTMHTIWSPSLLKFESKIKKHTEYSSASYSTESFGRFADKFDTLADRYDNFSDLDLMIPPKDMIFALWKKTLYHYANVKPSKKSIKKTWDDISKKIREKAIELNKEFEIFTKVEEDQILWIKLVYDKVSRHAVIIFVFENSSPDEGQCITEVEKCSGDNFVCCGVHDVHLQTMGIELNIKGVLDIN